MVLIVIVILIILNGQREFIVRKTGLDKMFFSLLILFVISGALNQVPIITLLYSFHDYFLPFIFYYLLLYCTKINEQTIKKILTLLYRIFFIQLILQLLQISVAIKDGTFNDDSAMGTFSGANNLSYTFFFLLFHATYYVYLYKDKMYTKRLVVFLTGMLASFGLFAILAYPFFFLTYNFKKIVKFSFLKRAIGLLIVLALIFSAFNKLNPQRQESSSFSNPLWMVDPSFYINYFLESEFSIYGGSNRMLWFPVTYDRLNSFAFDPLIGMGPGVYTSFAGFRTMSAPTESVYNIFNQIEYGYDPYVDSQLIPIWGEFGYIGLFLFLLLFVKLSISNYRYYKESEFPLTKTLSITASASSIYMLLGMYTNHVLETQTIMVTYILIVAMAEIMYKNEKNNNAFKKLN